MWPFQSLSEPFFLLYRVNQDEKKEVLSGLGLDFSKPYPFWLGDLWPSFTTRKGESTDSVASKGLFFAIFSVNVSDNFFYGDLSLLFDLATNLARS